MATHEARIRDWLIGLGTLVPARGSPDDFALRVNAMAAMLVDDYPPEAFSPASFRHCGSKIKFFPSYAEVRELLNDFRKPAFPPLEEPRNLLLPGRGPVSSQDLPPRTPKELAWADQIVRETTAALRHHQAEQEAHRNLPQWYRPTPEMTRAQLTEQYRREGIKGPQLPKPPLRVVAASIPQEVRRGPPLDHDA